MPHRSRAAARSSLPALLSLTLIAACSGPLPPGVESFPGGDQAFFWSPQAKRLAFVEGIFPNRTKAAVLDPQTSRRRSFRVKGYVFGGPLALSRDGRLLLAEAGKIGSASRAEPARKVLLLLDAETGRVLAEQALPGTTAALGHPAWASGPAAAWAGPEGLSWRVFSRSPEHGVVPNGAPWRGVFLDEPVLAAAEDKPPRLAAYALREPRLLASWPTALTPAVLGEAPDGRVLAARWVAGFGGYRLESLDPRTGRAGPRLETEGIIETALETSSALYAVAKDPSRSNASGRSWLAPRLLLVVEKSGARWSVPWSMREGRFLGVQDDGKLWFAVTDRNRPGLFRLAPTAAALKAAPPVLDGDLTGLGPAAKVTGFRALAGAAAAGAMIVLLLMLRR